MIELVINGDTVKVPDSIQVVSQLLAYFGLAQKVVIVEINRNIIEKSSHGDTPVRNGDRIEMVHFVGGG